MSESILQNSNQSPGQMSIFNKIDKAHQRPSARVMDAWEVVRATFQLDHITSLGK